MTEHSNKADDNAIRTALARYEQAAVILAEKQTVVTVAPITRQTNRESLLRENGACDIFVDSGSIVEDVRKPFPNGVDCVLDLVGTTMLKDSLQCAYRIGVVCITGVVGNRWSFDQLASMESIPTTYV